jgi:hypothetical protein
MPSNFGWRFSANYGCAIPETEFQRLKARPCQAGSCAVLPVRCRCVRRSAWLPPAFEHLDDDHASTAAETPASVRHRRASSSWTRPDLSDEFGGAVVLEKVVDFGNPENACSGSDISTAPSRIVVSIAECPAAEHSTFRSGDEMGTLGSRARPASRNANPSGPDNACAQPVPRLTRHMRDVILLFQLVNVCDVPHALRRCGMLHSCRVDWREPDGNSRESLEIAGIFESGPNRPIISLRFH